ncbi:nuclease-related domain-containing protein [Vallicoccus soli]|uniref:nuclease-related domain-containing protein n=1 Tax=Vallicoccus soli TaxID=2339232 RepID=UPI001402EB52|nr:nuclease-related domain-containing protein [Vallicoccus soli]
MLVPLTVGVLALSLLAEGAWAWVGAVWFGVVLGFWFYAVDAVPKHIENWASGAEGERRTERVLRPLERTGWHVVHDLKHPGAGNVDHLVLGPGGLFVLDSKVWGGVVSVDGTGATVTPRDNPDAAWTARGLHRAHTRTAAVVARCLAARSSRAVPAPRSVVVVWAPFPARVVVSGAVTYVVGEHLADWLLAHPRQLHREHLQALQAAARPDLLTDLADGPRRAAPGDPPAAGLAGPAGPPAPAVRAVGAP